MAFRDQEVKEFRLGDRPWAAVHSVNLGLTGKLACPRGCDEDGEVDRECPACAGFGYTSDQEDRIVKVVASEGRKGDWAAYVESVASHEAEVISGESEARALHLWGVKMVHEEALEVFPQWEARLRWRQ